MERHVTQGFLDRTAVSMLGIPYRIGGRIAYTGLDCYGLVREFFSRLGFTVADAVFEYTDVKWWVNEYEDIFHEHRPPEFEEIVEYWRPGAVVTFRVGKSFIPNHCGIMLPGRRLLNTAAGVGSHIARMDRLLDKQQKSYWLCGLVVDD